jgi:hypothetical protein
MEPSRDHGASARPIVQPRAAFAPMILNGCAEAGLPAGSALTGGRLCPGAPSLPGGCRGRRPARGRRPCPGGTRPAEALPATKGAPPSKQHPTQRKGARAQPTARPPSHHYKFAHLPNQPLQPT